MSFNHMTRFEANDRNDFLTLFSAQCLLTLWCVFLTLFWPIAFRPNNPARKCQVILNISQSMFRHFVLSFRFVLCWNKREKSTGQADHQSLGKCPKSFSFSFSFSRNFSISDLQLRDQPDLSSGQFVESIFVDLKIWMTLKTFRKLSVLKLRFFGLKIVNWLADVKTNKELWSSG